MQTIHDTRNFHAKRCRCRTEIGMNTDIRQRRVDYMSRTLSTLFHSWNCFKKKSRKILWRRFHISKSFYFQCEIFKCTLNVYFQNFHHCKFLQNYNFLKRHIFIYIFRKVFSLRIFNKYLFETNYFIYKDVNELNKN